MSTQVGNAGPKFFGEFLVEKRLLREEDLLGALIEQMRTLKPLPEMVHSMGLLTTGQVIQALSWQSRGQSDFRGACRELGLWGADFDTRLGLAIETARIPIGQLLVAQGKLQFADAARALDEYLSQGGGHRAAPISATPAAEPPSLVDEACTDKAAASGDWLGEFNLARLECLKRSLAVASQSTALADVQVVYQELGSLAGLFALSDASELKDLTAAMSRVFLAALKQSAIDALWMRAVADVLHESLHCAWDGKEARARGLSTRAFAEQAETLSVTLNSLAENA